MNTLVGNLPATTWAKMQRPSNALITLVDEKKVMRKKFLRLC